MNHYQTLGVNTNASYADIKKAYRDLVKIHHPDLNPHTDTHTLMLAINEAYEVLSDSQTRSLYDMALSGYAINITPKEETEAEKYRREYKRRKAHEERVHMENVIMLKFKFYKMERYMSYVFLAIGILFTLDYYVLPFQTEYEIDVIRSGRRQADVRETGGKNWLADLDLLDEYAQKGGDQISVSYSVLLRVPARVGLAGSNNRYRINGTLHSFRNIITVIILLFSAVVINNKEFNDFRLTCGLVPILLVIFQMLMALNYLVNPEYHF